MNINNITVEIISGCRKLDQSEFMYSYGRGNKEIDNAIETGTHLIVRDGPDKAIVTVSVIDSGLSCTVEYQGSPQDIPEYENRDGLDTILDMEKWSSMKKVRDVYMNNDAQPEHYFLLLEK